jgi:D-arginine dehydrogenase
VPDTKEFDFLIVGSGIAGASLADTLAASASVALIEAEDQPGYHATGRSAALFAPNYGSAPFRALARASAQFLRQPPADFSARPLVLARGSLNVARSEQLPQLETAAAEIRARGGRIDALTPQQARALIPPLRLEVIAGATYEPDVLDIDVAALLQGYLRRGRARGVTLLRGERVAGARRQGERWRVQLRAGELHGRVLVNAAGAWADAFAVSCGVRPLGLRPLRRTAAVIDAPAGMDVNAWPALFDIDEQFYVKPDAGRLLISPADEEPLPAGDVYADDLMVAVAVDRIQQALDLEVRRVAHSWAGLRTFARDRDPVIGFDPELPGFFWLCGQGGYGIQTAAAAAALAASLAQREGVPPALAAEGLDAAQVDPARLR